MFKAGSKGMTGMVVAILIVVKPNHTTVPHSHTAKGLAIHTHTTISYSPTHMLVLRAWANILMGVWPRETIHEFDCKWKLSTSGTQTPTCALVCICKNWLVFVPILTHNRRAPP